MLFDNFYRMISLLSFYLLPDTVPGTGAGGKITAAKQQSERIQAHGGGPRKDK